jgi:isoaspartyl peptidase/L-asparaginase-like protein (Ntn-hydrolase superfamily)
MPNSNPIAVATWKSGLAVVKRAGEILKRRGKLLDAIEQGCNVAELDPEDMSVGFGGLPNEDGVVELDAAIMDGRTHAAGSVMALRGIKTPISVARRVMEKTKHVYLAGDGALQFALREGFLQETLLTAKSLARYNEWLLNKRRPSYWNHDTMGLLARDAKGNLAGGCTTSGVGFKLAGRVGDSPIIGGGLYVDNDIGAAVATGLGEEILRVCAAHLVVERMRHGHSPQRACEEAAKQILAKTRVRPLPMAGILALRKDGAFGGASTCKGFSYAVWTPKGMEMQRGKFLVSDPARDTLKKMGLQ